MCNLFRSQQFSQIFRIVSCCALLLALAGTANTYAQGCPTLYSPNRGWAQNTIVRYAFINTFTEEEKRQIRAAAAEWSRANAINNSKVSFVEDISGQNFTLAFQTGSLPSGNPANYTASYNGVTLNIISATITYDPNNTFPSTSILIADPSQPGYSTTVMKLVLHEIGHTMGLNHPAIPADACDQPDGASTLNFACGINDQGNNIPTTIPSCDQDTLNSASIYPPISLPPPTVQIDSSSVSISVGEGGSVTITVTRSGDTSGAATVKYGTSDPTDVNFQCNPNTAGQITGAASRKCDYHIASGRLRFAAGESTKQITLSLVNDVYVEGNETLTLVLSNPTGMTLGANTTATVTITDNDLGGAANPIDGTSFYVRQLYVDLLSREPDAAGWNGWVSRIDLCGQPGQAPPPCDRVTVGGDGFLRSAEFFDRQFFVLRLYRTAFARILNYNEVGDLAYVSGFLTPADIESNKQDLVAEIMSRAEFGDRYNGLANAAFVDTLLSTAVVTVPQTDRNGWVTALNGSSKTRAQVYREISERQEVSNLYLHEAQVVSAYYGFFSRNPDGAYFSYLSRLDSGEINLGDLANAFINASEYRQRYGQ